ncbi:MAG: AAA family ATPase [Planctomycetia bacterium]|nr:AAA family ATPase [Planctomycetia bacterium]
MSATGLVLGKFLPPHAGHLHLVAEARRRVDRLAVVVGTLEREPIPGFLRAEWMRDLCPGCDVFHLAEDLPQEPADHPQFWDLWTAALRRFLPSGPDLVFTSEPYGDELARRLGARHVCIDPARAAVPVSGTAVRRDPLAHWDRIPACVRPWFAKRVVLYGPECAGKTALARRLSEAFGAPWVPEYARGHLDAKGAFIEPADVPHIVAGQIASENAAARASRGLVFCDSDVNTTVIYALHYLGTVPPWVARLSRRRPADLILFCEPDLPWEEDWQRDSPRRRPWFREWFRARLDEQGRAWTAVSGSGEGRFEAAKSAVAKALGILPRA